MPDGSLLVERRAGVWGEVPEPSRLIHYRPREGSDGSIAWVEEGELFGHLASAGDPFVSPDGRMLVFVAPSAAPDREDRDLWFAERTDDDGWGEPRPFPAPINSEHLEMGPSLDAAGNLLFSTTRPGGPGSGDLWLARREGDGYRSPEPLGEAINGPGGEWNGLLAPDGSFLIFEASGRETNVTPPGDLYVSRRSADGTWTPAVPLEALNGPGSELNPRLSPDGRWLLYASTSDPTGEGRGEADLWRVPWEAVERSFEEASEVDSPQPGPSPE